MDEKIESFIEARNHVFLTVPQKIEIFLLGEYNPINKHMIIKETVDIIQNELIQLYPDIPVKYLPRCRFRIHEDLKQVEAGIQYYYNHEPELQFLGATAIGDEMIDCYYRHSYDPRFEYMFIAKFGHGKEDYHQGSKTAEAEYYLGQKTPLSMAYGLAVEDGFIG